MKRINIAPLRQLSAHLHTREIAQKSHQAAKTFDAALVDLFELIRQYSGNKPIKINSAFRDYIPVGGVAYSAHMRGNAFYPGKSVPLFSFPAP